MDAATFKHIESLLYKDSGSSFSSRDGRIYCNTKEETQRATNMLLDLGFMHGDSGYSKMFSAGKILDELDCEGMYSWYASPSISSGKIEYSARKGFGSNDVLFCDFEAYYYETRSEDETLDGSSTNMKQLFALL